MEQYMKLSDYARQKSVTYTTAWNHFRKGLIVGAQKDASGHVLVPIPKVDINTQAVLYARVSAHQMKDNLLRQQERLEEFAHQRGFNIVKSVKEIGSGMNDTRPKLSALLTQDDWGTLIVEHRDRLTRFGFNHLQLLLEKQGKTILVVNPNGDERQDLLQDLVSVVYSFSAKLYGLRKQKKKEDIIEFLSQ